MKTYYSQRANTYDRIYQKPERQADLLELEDLLKEHCAERTILDLGCGTGYWMEKVSAVAASITGIDFSPSVLELARERKYGCQVAMREQSFYELEQIGERFQVVAGGFVASHIPNERMAEFLVGLKKVLLPGGKVVLYDNRYVEGSSTPLSRTDEQGNTYQTRHLDNGQSFEVLKNFPSRMNWENWLPAGTVYSLTEFEYYWLLEFHYS